VVMSFMPKEYKSRAQISTGFTITNEFISAEEGFNPRDADMKFSNLIETMKSPLVIGLVSYKLMIHDLRDTQPFKNIDLQQDAIKKIFIKDDRGSIHLSKEQLITLYNDKLDSLKLLTSYDKTERQLLDIMSVYNYD